MGTRGQGAFEYILLIGGVLAVAIIVILLLKGGIFGTGTATIEIASSEYASSVELMELAGCDGLCHSAWRYAEPKGSWFAFGTAAYPNIDGSKVPPGTFRTCDGVVCERDKIDIDTPVGCSSLTCTCKAPSGNACSADSCDPAQCAAAKSRFSPPYVICDNKHNWHGWFSTLLKVPASMSGQSIYFTADRIDDSAIIYVNGAEAARLGNWCDGPFWNKQCPNLDLTSKLQYGKENRVLIVLEDYCWDGAIYDGRFVTSSGETAKVA